jgi:hypothetical protein
MTRLGIIAYGSLIKCPGDEIKKAETDRIDVETTFEVEFARSSVTRDGAPTLVPFKGGAKVKAVMIVLKDYVTRGASDGHAVAQGDSQETEQSGAI